MTVNICGYDVIVVRRKMKSVKLSVKMDGRIVVSAPPFASMKLICGMVEKNTEWIAKCLMKVRGGQPCLADGVRLRIAGSSLLFVRRTDRPYGARQEGNIVYVHAPEDRFYKCAEQFISDKLLEYITQKIRHYEQLTGLKVKNILIRNVQSSWGTCVASTATVKFSQYLAYQPVDAIDYVVLHEIAHLKYHNHGKAFYDYIANFMPDYKNIQKNM